MKTLYKITWLFCLFAFNSFAQSIDVTGVIKDDEGQVLESASVIALTKDTNKLEAYSITSAHGKYSISLKQGSLYSLKVSFVGFAPTTYELDLRTEVNDLVKDFSLSKDINTLDKVVLTYEMPIKVQGDTIMYAADSFSNGTEKKLGDILKKLPGVEVNDDGQIEVEGKQVQKVMVEGKDFFDGDSKLAVENIPSNSIDKIEVLKNYSEISQLRNVTNNEDNIAINIKLKSGKKNFWFGEITAGGGLDSRYIAHPKLFYYSPEKSLNVITDINNIGEIPFTRRDYFSFTGGFKNASRDSGTSLNLTSDNLGFSSLMGNRANDVLTKFGALNFDYKVNEGLDVSGYFIYSNTDIDMFQKTMLTYNDGLVESRENTTNQNNHIGLGKFSALYKPHENFQLDYDLFLKVSKQEEEGELKSSFSNVENNINSFKNDEPFSIQQNANINYTLNEDHIFSSELQFLLSKEQPFYNATFLGLGTDPSSDNLPFSTLFPYENGQEDYSINQDKTIETTKADAKVDYYYVISPSSNINVTVGNVWTNQIFDSSIFQVLDSGIENEFTSNEFNNDDVRYTFSDVFLGLKYKVTLGKFTLTPGLILHNYGVTNEQLGVTNSTNETLLLPRLYANFQIKKSESLRFTYSRTAEYADVNTIAEGYVFNNYNSLFQGNGGIQNGLYENFKLSYYSFSLYSHTNIFASLNYSKKKDAIKNDVIFTQINRVSTPINSSQTDETFSANTRWEKTFGKIKANAKGNLNFSKLYNIFEGTQSKSESFTQNYTGSLLTNFKNWPNFEVGYQYTVNKYNNVNAENTFYTSKPFANLEWLMFKSFTLKADYDWYNYTNQDDTIDNKYSFLDASIAYQKKDTKWEYKLGVTNLLNTKSINNDSFNQNYSSTNQYYVQPRYLVLSVKYNL
ncbi:TonB-dependent receptor [Wenyingzhuangia sp. 1_MG-2023]|nr:TonB-dependent receptor [Wenyingzhuangia sp. 1_MG-2023]